MVTRGVSEALSLEATCLASDGAVCVGNRFIASVSWKALGGSWCFVAFDRIWCRISSSCRLRGRVFAGARVLVS